MMTVHKLCQHHQACSIQPGAQERLTLGIALQVANVPEPVTDVHSLLCCFVNSVGHQAWCLMFLSVAVRLQKRAGAKGFGLFATKPIVAGQFVIEYIGEVLEEDEYVRRKEFYLEVRFRLALSYHAQIHCRLCCISSVRRSK